ncbi:MAG: GGDEF domain-containing protein [Thiohalobacterales bacterium]|nr:GGDEF domain-containing protein [Thiohalobacterales bacterium]
MQRNSGKRAVTGHEAEDLRSFSRSMAGLQWLLLILVLLYFFIPIREISDRDAMIVTMVTYSLFVVVFRYLNFQARETRFKLAVETWIMVGFITAVLWHTGYTESPLVNLYLLAIIASAITLGRIMTLLEVGLIACCYLLTGFKLHSVDIFTPGTFTLLMAHFSPFMLVAWVTSILASDILSAKQRIARLTEIDDLTGVMNMRTFNGILRREIELAKRYAATLTIIKLDVDGLRTINDRFGHAAGNRLLQTVAAAMQACLGPGDVLARYGGDDFVVLLRESGTDAARNTAERMRTAVANTSFDVMGQRISATASIGIASYPHCVSDLELVIDRADTALCSSKQAGRDRVTYYEGSIEELPVCA